MNVGLTSSLVALRFVRRQDLGHRAPAGHPGHALVERVGRAVPHVVPEEEHGDARLG